MNQEIQRTFVLKLIGASVVAVGVWYIAVAPQVNRVEDLKSAYRVQLEDVREGESTMQLQGDRVQTSIGLMSSVRDELAQQFIVGQESAIHKHLQESAEALNLTVSRIEPLRTSLVKHAGEPGEDAVKLETKEFRIECVGTYDEIVRYIDILNRSINVTKINAFQIEPISGDLTRLILQVSVYQLKDIPDTFADTGSESMMKMTDAGDSNGDI